MNEKEEQNLLMKVLELVILRHQVSIVDVEEREDCFGFQVTDVYLKEAIDFIVNDQNIEEVLPTNYKICKNLIEDTDGFVGFCKK